MNQIQNKIEKVIKKNLQNLKRVFQIGKDLNFTEDEREIFNTVQQAKIKIMFITDLRTEIMNQKFSYTLKKNERSYLDLSEEVLCVIQRDMNQNSYILFRI